METRSLSEEQGFSCGDGCGYDYAFPQGSCGGSGVRFFFQNGVWQSFCRGAVLCEGKQTAGRILQGGELFVLNAAAHFAVQFLKDTGADAENIGSTPKLVDCEQMTVWRGAQPSKNAPIVFQPKRHDPAKQLWREFSSMFMAEKNAHLPGVVQWLVLLQNPRFRLLGSGSLIRFRIMGVEYGDKDFFIADTFSDELRAAPKKGRPVFFRAQYSIPLRAETPCSYGWRTARISEI